MASEIRFTGSLSVYKSTVMSSAIGRTFNDLIATMTGNFVIEGTISVATSGTAIPLGQVTQPGWAFFVNKDATNFVRLANGSGGAKLVKLLATEPAFFRLDDTATPYAFADSAACLLEFLVISL